jgi:hypothetical protein
MDENAPKKDIKESKKLDKYEVEAAARDLLRAKEIEKNPELFKAVKEHLSKQKKSIESIEDIREAAEEMAEKDESEDD